jgi:hypothetical protein
MFRFFTEDIGRFGNSQFEDQIKESKDANAGLNSFLEF